MIKEFLEHVLPDVGSLKVWTKENKRHYTGDLDYVVAKIAELEAEDKWEIYHACSSFYDGGRTQDNVMAVKSFWLDVDGYKTDAPKAASLQALKAFIAEVKIPVPTIVDSGNGIHCYWVLDKNIDSNDWDNTARYLKEATIKFGLQVDHSRTCDSASVLRPVGTTNKKFEKSPKPVQLLKLTEQINYETFHAALKSYVGEIFGGLVIEGTLNSDLEISRDPLPPVSSDRIGDVCAQIEYFRNTKGDVPEPFWFAGLGVLAYTSDGATKAHEWSKGHPNYSAAETDDKLAHASKQSGMTTCATLQSASPQPDLCKTCPFYQKCNTPRAAELQAARPNVVPIRSEDGAEEADSLFANAAPPAVEEIYVPETWAIFGDTTGYNSIYVWSNTDMSWWDASSTDRTARGNYTLMIRGMLYSNNSDYMEDRHGNYTIKLVYLHGPNNTKRKTLTMGGSQIAATRELMGKLGEKGITCMGNMERHLSDYVKRIAQHHQTLAQQRQMYNHFGWHEDDFLVGEKLYKGDGSIETVTLSKTVLDKAHILKPTGTLDEWKNIIHTAYNHPGCESLQFAVLTGFAAPLMSHYQQYGGVCVHLYSAGSGKGKTTAAQAALSVWGNPIAMQLSDKQATVNAIYATMGLYHNLPILYDEITNKEDDTVADFVHVASSGQPKQRCDATGKIIDNDNSWKTIVLTSGNKKLSDKLRSTRDNIEAETARIFETTVDVRHHLVSSEAIRLFGNLLHNYGTAGAVYAEYISRNKVAVGQTLNRALDQIGTKFGTTSSERYWSVLLASVMVANHICTHLGLLNFDKVALTEWIKKTVAQNRNTMIEVTPTVDDAFGRMLTELWQGMIVTEGEGTFVGGRWAKVEHKPKDKIFGRCIVDRVPENNKVYISSTAMKNWCIKNGKNYKEFLGEMIDGKMVSSYISRYPLGKGTVEYDRLPETEVVTLTAATVASMLSNGNLVSIPGGKNEASKVGVL